MKKFKHIFYDVIISSFFLTFNNKEKVLIFLYKSKNFDYIKFTSCLVSNYNVDSKLLDDFFSRNLTDYDLLKNVHKTLSEKIVNSINNEKSILTYFIPKYSLMKRMCSLANEKGYKIYLLSDAKLKENDDKLTKLNVQFIKI